MQCKLKLQPQARHSHSCMFIKENLCLFGSCVIRPLSTKYRSTLSADMSTDSQPICRPSIGRYVGRHIRYSSETMFGDNLFKFKLRLIKRGYPKKLIRRTLSEVNFATRQSALLQINKTRKRVLPFVTTYQP